MTLLKAVLSSSSLRILLTQRSIIVLQVRRSGVILMVKWISFVAGVGTGGTVSGVGKYLKEKNPTVKIVAVEPSDSPVLSGGQSGPHKIQGIGAGFIPNTYNAAVVDEVFQVENDEAILAGRQLVTTGWFIGRNLVWCSCFCCSRDCQTS